MLVLLSGMEGSHALSTPSCCEGKIDWQFSEGPQARAEITSNSCVIYRAVVPKPGCPVGTPGEVSIDLSFTHYKSNLYHLRDFGKYKEQKIIRRNCSMFLPSKLTILGCGSIPDQLHQNLLRMGP